ncbi:unnamed protein product [Periconia digitata]|uniref:Uncharacterized protein n=1 Tax=Periconia digitata TaxID=1303443 RepID=A0A9W4XYY3_9PLEO|nr:unnamed protein product [Periconia digitata]
MLWCLKGLFRGNSHPSSRGGANTDPTGSAAIEGSSNDKSFATVAPTKDKGENLGLKTLYAPDSPEDIHVDIVFLHGLTENSYNTWLHKESGVHWPSQLLNKSIEHSRILAFGYDARVASFWGRTSRNRLANHADNLVDQLAGLKEDTDTEKRPTIFVAHSLGGLVVEKALQVSAESAKPHLRTVEQGSLGILFMGTPHSGSDFAPFAKSIGNILSLVGKRVNVNILDTLKRDSQTLLDVEDWFGHWRRRRAETGAPIHITTFYEELELPVGGKVVEEFQAKITGYFSYGIHGNHMDMTKFPRTDDPGYVVVQREIRRWYKEIRSPTVAALKNTTHPRFQELIDQLQQHTSAYAARKDVNPDRISGTCEWFVNHEKFKHWNNGVGNGLLWVSADPGCGKSVLAKYLVDEVLARPNRSICYFFFKDGYPDQQFASNALCAILHQLYLQQPERVRSAVIDRFLKDKKNMHGSISNLWNIIVGTASDSKHGEVVCVLDALDECQAKDSREFAKRITRYFSKASTNFKCIVLSRTYQRIQWQSQELEKDMPMIHLSGENETEIQEIVKEIDLVIKSRVSSLGRKRKLLEEEINYLQDLLTAVPNRIYLWVTLTLNIIENLSGFTKGNIIRTVKRLPQTVDEAYSWILSKSTDPNKTLKAFHCVTAAYRPLTVKQLMLMITIEDDKTPLEFSKDLEPTERFRSTLRSLCGICLVIIDEKVYFLHQTVREFLVSPSGSSELSPSIHNIIPWKHSILIEKSHSTALKACLWLILWEPSSFQSSDSLPSSDRRFMGENDKRVMSKTARKLGGLRYYALYRWNSHLDSSDCGKEEVIIRKVLDVLHPEFQSRMNHPANRLSAYYSEAHTTETNMLIGATVLGFQDVVKFLLRTTNADINAREASGGLTPLSLTIFKGFEGIFTLYMAEKAINPSIVDSRKWTALNYAIRYSRVPMVAVLLKHVTLEVTPDAENPLLTFIRNDRYTDDRKTLDLMMAQPSFDINAPLDEAGDVAITMAASTMDSSLMKHLLRHPQVAVNVRNRCGQTALIIAVKRGDSDSVKLLLRHPAIDVNSADEDGQTALIQATKWNRPGITGLLLQHPALDVNIADVDGETALTHAVSRNHSKVIEFLHEHPQLRSVKAKSD